MEICSKCQICSYITLLNSGLRPQKIAVILKICVGFPVGGLNASRLRRSAYFSFLLVHQKSKVIPCNSNHYHKWDEGVYLKVTRINIMPTR